MIRRRTITSYEWHVATGNETVVLLNCVKSFFRRLELIGGTEQLTTTGKNLFDESKAVTGRINPDNGELLPETSYISSDYIEVQEGETYFQSGSGDGYYRAFYDMNKKFTSIPTKGIFKITVPVGSKFLRISGRKERFGDWMIEKGDKATDYEPYTGLKSSPSPEYPQEIKNVGRKSKNLLDINYFKDKNNLQTIQCEGFSLLGIICNVKPNTEYTLSANLNGAKYNLNIANKTKRFSLTSAPSRTLVSNDDGTLYIGFYGVTADNVNMDDFMQQYKNIQLEEGNKTAYEPYSDKYLLDVKVNGKNLFDREKARDISNWIVRENDGYAKFPIRVGKGNKVTFSYTEKLTAGKGFYLGITQSETSAVVAWLYHSAETNLNNNKHTVVAAGDYIYLSCTKSGIQKFVDTIQTLQVEISDGQTPYELYTEQALTLTSDRPITKWDKLVEQGGQYGWLYQSAIDTDVKPSRVDLFPNGFSLFKDFGNGVYVYKVTNIKKAIGFQTSLCEQFKNKDGSYSTGDLFCYSDQPSMQMQYFVTDIPTLEEFKTWMETNPLTMVYKTTESHFIPLPESEQTQLRNLHSYIGTTNIMVDSGEVSCGINVEYKTKS